MKVHYGLAPIHIVNPVVTMGSFDGVHKGHRQVIDGLKRCAEKLEGETVIITFDPHPREVLYPLEKRPGILTTLKEKIQILSFLWNRPFDCIKIYRGIGRAHLFRFRQTYSGR